MIKQEESCLFLSRRLNAFGYRGYKFHREPITIVFVLKMYVFEYMYALRHFKIKVSFQWAMNNTKTHNWSKY